MGPMGKISVMPRSLLSPLALVSVIALGICLFGFAATFGPIFQNNIFDGPKPQIVRFEASFQYGCVNFAWEEWDIRPAGGTRAGMQVFWRQVRYRHPDLRRSVWVFDAHSLASGNGTWIFLVAFPIWCIALPLLIAPLIWFRKRRSLQLSAFPVVMPTNAKPD